jgi:hypothetical protein
MGEGVISFAIFAVNGFFSIFAVLLKCPDGGIGRRAGLKHQWQQCCAGSIPAPGTFSNKALIHNNIEASLLSATET